MYNNQERKKGAHPSRAREGGRDKEGEGEGVRDREGERKLFLSFSLSRFLFFFSFCFRPSFQIRTQRTKKKIHPSSRGWAPGIQVIDECFTH
jgi:hypothetical protein